MRLGATIGQYAEFPDPEDYVAECRKWKYRSAPCPKVNITDREKIRSIKEAFSRSDIVIGEVQAWVNPLDPRQEIRKQNLKQIAESLAIADEAEAVCCVTVVGSYDTRDEIGCDNPHPNNFSDRCFEEVVEWTRKVLKEVQPRRTKLTLEISPWTLLDGPEVYRRLIDAVQHPGLGVHLDPANAIRDGHLFYATTGLLNRCFDLLGQSIVCCHAKDLYHGPVLNQINLVEVIPGTGVLDYRTYLARIEQISPETPLIIEHLTKPEHYAQAAAYIRAVAREVGVTA
jgi:sugar phosphate isomerase/epimerase